VIPTKFLLGIANINPKYGLNLDFGLKSSDILTSFGLQYKMLNDKLRLYSSVKLTIRSYTEKTVSLIEPSAGVEYVFDGFNIAYAFNLPLSGIDSFGNHTVSVSYKFGPVVKLPEDTSVLYAKIDKLEQQLREKEQEIEQLKKKLDELLSKPLPKEEEKLKKPEVKPKEKVVPPAVPTEEKPKEKVEEKKEMTPKQQYEELFNRYLSKKEEMPLVEQIKVVDTIIKQFKDKTDVSSAQKELNSLLKQQKAANDELQMSKSYYYKLKSAGTSPAELKVLLERIKKKYDGYGLDLKWIDEELQKLK
jgi:regulator of replication initiation timing